MKTKTLNLLLLLLIAGSTNSCKKEKKCESEICELEGKYRIEVKVSKRLPLLPNIPDGLDTTRYVRQEIFYSRNQILLDTGANVCCSPNIVGWQRQCPPLEYTFTGVEIIKENGNYYIKGGSTFNLPIIIKEDEISYNVIRDSFLGNGIFAMQRHSNSTSQDPYYTSYNTSFRVFLLNLKKNGDNRFSGTWIINEALTCGMVFPGHGEVISFPGSKPYRPPQFPNEYTTVEFAEVIFVKED
ncbi:MAG: hypothetical protein J5I91_01850 [Bacteroidetes bacterium]|nr:hypothetical protein [Bacteroidota bacterium]